MPADRIVHILGGSAAFCDHVERLLRFCGLASIVHETDGDGLYPAAEMTAGCVLLDIETPGTAWLGILARLKAHGVHLPVVVMAPAGDAAMAVHARKMGAVDVLERPFDDHRLIAAIEAALEDPPGIATHHAVTAAARQLAVLSRRERQVLDAIVAGHANKVIAHNLAISMRTVEVHRARILERLGIRAIAEAIRLAALASLAPVEEGEDKASEAGAPPDRNGLR
jgi:two-component system response regulator FixJ